MDPDSTARARQSKDDGINIDHSEERTASLALAVAVSVTNQYRDRTTARLCPRTSPAVHLTSHAIQHGYQDGDSLRVLQSSSRRHMFRFLDRMGPRKTARLNSAAGKTAEDVMILLCADSTGRQHQIIGMQASHFPHACSGTIGGHQLSNINIPKVVFFRRISFNSAVFIFGIDCSRPRRSEDINSVDLSLRSTAIEIKSHVHLPLSSTSV